MGALSKKNVESLRKGLVILAANRDRLGDLLEWLDCGLPNLKMKTMGGKMFWEDVVKAGGWRVQRNKLLKNCRLLDPEDKRVAWGGESAMIRAFNKLLEIET